MNSNNMFVINLEKRRDRLISFFKKSDIYGFKAQVFKAVEGLKVEKTDMLDEFESNLFDAPKISKGELGCFLSHYRLWITCIKLNLPYIIIFEDDVNFTSSINNAIETFQKIINTNTPFDLIYFGGRFDPNFTPTLKQLSRFFEQTNIEGVYTRKSFEPELSIERTSHAYILSLEGARKLVHKCLEFSRIAIIEAKNKQIEESTMLMVSDKIMEWCVVNNGFTSLDIFPHACWSPYFNDSNIRTNDEFNETKSLPQSAIVAISISVVLFVLIVVIVPIVVVTSKKRNS